MTKVIEINKITAYIEEPTILNDYKAEPPRINWPSIGSVDIKTATKFANDILNACHLAKEEYCTQQVTQPMKVDGLKDGNEAARKEL